MFVELNVVNSDDQEKIKMGLEDDLNLAEKLHQYIEKWDIISLNREVEKVEWSKKDWKMFINQLQKQKGHVLMDLVI